MKRKEVSQEAKAKEAEQLTLANTGHWVSSSESVPAGSPKFVVEYDLSSLGKEQLAKGSRKAFVPKARAAVE